MHTRHTRIIYLFIFLVAFVVIFYIQAHYNIRIELKNAKKYTKPNKGYVGYKIMTSKEQKEFKGEKDKYVKQKGISKPKESSHIENKKDKSRNVTIPKKVLLGDLTYKTILQSDKPQFLEDYSAPCVKEVENDTGSRISKLKVNCLPAVYLVGQPKCGSTDIYDFLVRHPLIIHTTKEPQYWSRRRYHPGKEELRNYFKVYENASLEIQQECAKRNKYCKHKKIFIDGSVSLLWDNTNWPLIPGNAHQRVPRVLNAHHIRHLTPKVKIIVILRHPVEREYSSYLYFSKKNVSANDFHRKVQWSIYKFNNCSKIWGARTCAYNVTIKQTLPIRLYIGLYSIFIRDWLKIFPRKQFYFIRLEDYTENRIKYVQDIIKFIGVEQPPDWFLKLNDKPVNNKRPSTKSIEDMLPETRKLLQDFFQPFNNALARILDDNNYLYP